MLSDDTSYFDVFSTVSGSESWNAQTDCDWIVLSSNGGETSTDERVNVTVDWSKTTVGTQNGSITVTNSDGTKVAVFVVKAVNKNSFDYGENRDYVETNGYVMIETETYSENIKGTDGSEWQKTDVHMAIPLPKFLMHVINTECS